MSRILLAGEDLHLLETRAAVLARTGASVLWGTSQKAELLLTSECFDLLVLCHTLSDRQREKITALANRRWPMTTVLQLVTSVCEEQTVDKSHGIRTSVCEPRRLIHRTEAILMERAKGQYANPSSQLIQSSAS
jgi:DNA-binding response OmpR family regulator